MGGEHWSDACNTQHAIRLVAIGELLEGVGCDVDVQGCVGEQFFGVDDDLAADVAQFVTPRHGVVIWCLDRERVEQLRVDRG